jgi:hypothetical protein
VGTSRARYGSVDPNRYPLATFRDTFSFVPDSSPSSEAGLDANAAAAGVHALGGCPSARVVCVSSGYGGEMTWQDSVDPSQNTMREEQAPEVEVLVAVFPSQLEGDNGTRGWGGAGWGQYGYQTELTHDMTTFNAALYHLTFMDGHVVFAPGTTCEPARREGQACPDKYDAGNALVRNWEQELLANPLQTFPGKPPGVIIGAYPPGGAGFGYASCLLKMPVRP